LKVKDIVSDTSDTELRLAESTIEEVKRILTRHLTVFRTVATAQDKPPDEFEKKEEIGCAIACEGFFSLAFYELSTKTN
jgi:hypothetical protein